MSDDRIVSLQERRPPQPSRLTGTLCFSNHALRMPMEPGMTSPVWTLDTLDMVLDGREQASRVRVRFGLRDQSPDGSSGEVWENEQNVFAFLYLERDLFEAFQAAAFSARRLTLFVTFNSVDGAPPSIMLAVEPQWSDA